MIEPISLINNALQWCSPSLLATATEGESYGKALAVSLALVSLSIYVFSRFFEEIAARLVQLGESNPPDFYRNFRD
ncbi:hypothetical protein WH8501_28535 [Crocosphaera watsonii WH 8501]|uniref:hypothetical protein n=1 Tax=Crocosphaera TaxID=263510 RepID=UPI000039C3DC|nr:MULTISPECIES: hypothetical protein [Crocosphaera]